MVEECQTNLMDLLSEDDAKIPLRERFLVYHKKNPHVFKKFCECTLDAISRGHKHLGAKCIGEVMRFFRNFKTNEHYKVDNSYLAFYSRMFESLHPEYKGFFSKRKSKADD